MSSSEDRVPEGVVPLVRLSADAAHESGASEPLRCGLPFPEGLLKDPRALSLHATNGQPVTVQADVTMCWPDGSIKWAVLHWLAVPGCRHYDVIAPPGPDLGNKPGNASAHLSAPATTHIHAGATEVTWEAPGQTLAPAIRLGAGERPVPISLDIVLVDAQDGVHRALLSEVHHELSGPVLERVRLHGTMQLQGRRLETELVLSAYAGTALLEVELRLRNPHKAIHPGGKWILGDAGSQHFKRLSCHFINADAAEDAVAHIYPEPGQPRERGRPVLCYQDSSGTERWQSVNHMDRNGQVHRTHRGYLLTGNATNGEASAPRLRASPVAVIQAGDGLLAGALDQFWQQFPKQLQADAGGMVFDLFTDRTAEVHELQGGEQKAHTMTLALCRDGGTQNPLPWVASRTLVSAPANWYAQSRALPYLASAEDDTESGYQALLDECLEGENSFGAKREQIDEYGWRHFGDLYADHENRHYKGQGPVISHYNNQYDAVAAFAAQFMRSGDRRWYDLYVELARHVLDLDIYHTDEDRAVYNRGMFWHTDHYQTADRSTHRTYPDLPGVHGGGPSAEHLYAPGLALYYMMTGDRAARTAAIGLGEYVIACDDGTRNVLKWLDRGATGAASWSGSMDYHGPGRGGGNALDALLTALELSGDRRFLNKAEELLRRCINPADDFEAYEIRDVEFRWFYMVFLRSVLKYLDWKDAHGERDRAYDLARASLLHYMRFALEFEYVYLERPELLEFPTEAWTGQEFRKAEVFYLTARYAPADLQQPLREKGRYFFRRAVDDLLACDERGNTRVQVLLTQFGWRRQWLESNPDSTVDDSEVKEGFPPPEPFVRQKMRAKRRLIQIAATGAVVFVAGAGWLIM